MALIALAFVSRDYLAPQGSEARAVIDNLPYLVTAIAIFMAYQFNRSRLLLASFGVAVFYWVVQRYLQLSLADETAAQVYLACSLALPVLSFYLLLLPERGIWNLYGFTFSIAFLLLGLLCTQLGPWLPQVNETAMNYYAPWPAQGYVFSVGASALMALVTLIGMLILLSRNEETEAALLGSVLAMYLTLALLYLEHISVVLCTAAALSLLWGLLRSSHSMAYRDELTGLPGRRALNERIGMLGNNYSIAMLDVDHFKKFNDTYGHDVGDEVLRLVASRIGKVGGGGTAYRYGGEEFCVVFPRRNLDECVEPIGKVREEIADYRMSIRNKNLRPVLSKDGSRRRGATRLKTGQVSVTVSAGVAERSEDHPDVEAVIAEADRCLYKAKRAGRNRVAS